MHAAFKASGFPEVCCPGRFDFVFSSHQASNLLRLLSELSSACVSLRAVLAFVCKFRRRIAALGVGDLPRLAPGRALPRLTDRCGWPTSTGTWTSIARVDGPLHLDATAQWHWCQKVVAFDFPIFRFSGDSPLTPHSRQPCTLSGHCNHASRQSVARANIAPVRIPSMVQHCICDHRVGDACSKLQSRSRLAKRVHCCAVGSRKTSSPLL